MSLIFLDTPQIDLLERVRRSDPVRYSSFLDTWKGRGCTLVFTTTQASELGRYPDPTRREGRYRVLADLAPIRTDFLTTENRSGGPRTLIEREILRAMVERRLITVTGPGAAELLEEWTDVLPGCLNAGEVGLLKVMIEDQDYQDVENRMYNAIRFAAAAAKADGQGKERLVRHLAGAPVPTEKASACRKEIEHVVASMEEQSRLKALPPIPADALAAFQRLALEFLARTEEIGPRGALRERLPITRDEGEQLKMTTDERVNCFVFEYQVRTFARQAFNVAENEQDFLARSLDFADCPGSWLRRRLELCVRRGSLEPLPSHHFDAERLAYLPYVDLLLTDAQMAEFVREVRNDESTPAPIRDVRRPMAIPTSLDALEAALDSLEPRRSGQPRPVLP